jgi:hypothetical protein
MTSHVRYSNSVVLVWQVAEFEARQLEASTIEPVHLLLGLSKMVDLDLAALIPKELPRRDDVLEECLREVRRLRNVFRDADLHAATFRRSLRRPSEERRFCVPASERLHRTGEAKKVFADAEQLSRINLGMVYPIHLLFAVLGIRDEYRDRVMKGLGIQKATLFEAATRELLSGRDTRSEKVGRVEWN